MAETSSPTDVVLAWLAAVNDGDFERALARTAADVSIIRPHVSGRGRDVLRSWLEHSAPRFETRAVYASGDEVVVAQRGVWTDVASGEIRVEPEMATRFCVVAGEITEIERYANEDDALQGAGLARESARVARNEPKSL